MIATSDATDLKKNESMFSLFRRLLTQHCPHMLLCAVLRRNGAFAAERRRLLSRDAQQQTRRLLSMDGTDRWTDRQTDRQTGQRSIVS